MFFFANQLPVHRPPRLKVTNLRREETMGISARLTIFDTVPKFLPPRDVAEAGFSP
ncbi:MAG: hypothetical protein H0V90_13010 [Blastocatellia bacterium]|nr:hypothetical protein [Blastocatellia bacterium]